MLEVTVVDELALLGDGCIWVGWLAVTAAVELGLGVRLLSWMDTVVAIPTEGCKMACTGPCTPAAELQR